MIAAVTAMVLALQVALLPSAQPRACETGAHATGSALYADATCSTGSGSGPDSTPGNTTDPYEAYRWELLCQGPIDPLDGACVMPVPCPDGQSQYGLYGLKDGHWIALGSACRSDDATTPTITPALVATAFQRVPLPHLRPIAQPRAKTLVNFDTIFHVEAEPLDRNLTLLGQSVELAITPATFDWSWGDGTTSTTDSPGAAYPSRAVTHRYLDADTTVAATVTVTWTARWRVNGGAWADVPGSVRTTGPAATLRVVEAVPNLAGPG